MENKSFEEKSKEFTDKLDAAAADTGKFGCAVTILVFLILLLFGLL